MASSFMMTREIKFYRQLGQVNKFHNNPMFHHNTSHSQSWFHTSVIRHSLVHQMTPICSLSDHSVTRRAYISRPLILVTRGYSWQLGSSWYPPQSCRRQQWMSAGPLQLIALQQTWLPQITFILGRQTFTQSLTLSSEILIFDTVIWQLYFHLWLIKLIDRTTSYKCCNSLHWFTLSLCFWIHKVQDRVWRMTGQQVTTGTMHR